MSSNPTMARQEAMNVATSVRNKSLTAQMNRRRLGNYRGRQMTAANVELAMPKMRQPLGNLADRGVPFNTEDDEELREIRRWCRLFYSTHDLIPLLIDIYSKFPCVGMEFDSKDPLIKEFYEDMFLGDDLNYLEFLPDQFGREYFTVGEVTSLAHFSESLGVWSSEEILNPDMLRVSRSMFVRRDRVQLLVKEMVDNMRRGPMSEGMTASSAEETPSERMQRTREYCFVPETRVLTEALEWVPVGSLSLSDKLIAFDEHGDDTSRTGRRWRGADVTATSIIQAPCYNVRTSDGTVTCTDQHKFLARRGAPGTGRGNNRGNGRTLRRWQWIEAQDLRPGDEIKHMPTWDFTDSYEAGWLSGIFDGEGSLCVSEKSQSLVVYQNRGPVLDRIIDILERHKFTFTQDTSDSRGQGVQIYIKGGITEVMRFLGIFRPERLSPKVTKKFYGRPLASKCVTLVQVVSTEFVGTRDVVALATSTKTLIAEGLFSHNTELARDYPEVIQAAAQDDGLDMSEALISRVVNRSTPWATRGTPLLMRSFATLMNEESLNAAQNAVADRLYAPMILATLGSPDLGDGEPWIPDQSELDDLRDDMQAILASDFRFYAHNFGLKIESVFGRESVPNLDNDFERIQIKLLQAWGIGEALISGGTGGAYASSALNREFVTQMMVGFQNSLRRHILKRAEVVAEAQGHWDYDLRGGQRVPIFREIEIIDEETGRSYTKQVPKLLLPEVKFSTLNLRDEAQERAFIAQLKSMGVPISDNTLAVNIDVEFDQELERQADETVQKLMATAQAMRKVQMLCDAQDLPYPPELAQHLMSTLQLRQGDAQTKQVEVQEEVGEVQADVQMKQLEMQDQMMDQQMSGQQPMLPPAGAPPGGAPPGGAPPSEGGGEEGPVGGPGQAGAPGPGAPGPGAPGPGNVSAGGYTAKKGALSAEGPVYTPTPIDGPSAGMGPALPPGVPKPTEIPRNRQRPPESDDMRKNMPAQTKATPQSPETRKGRRKGELPREEDQPRRRGRFEHGPSSYGARERLSEDQVRDQVRRLESVWTHRPARHPKVSDLVNDPTFYRATNNQAYQSQIQADWPEILAGNQTDSNKILDDMLEQYLEIFGVEPQW